MAGQLCAEESQYSVFVISMSSLEYTFLYVYIYTYSDWKTLNGTRDDVITGTEEQLLEFILQEHWVVKITSSFCLSSGFWLMPGAL